MLFRSDDETKLEFVPDLSNPLHEGLQTPRRNGTTRTTQPIRTPKQSIAKYGFNQTSDIPDAPETPEEKRSKKARREAFKRKLLGDNSLFSRQSEVRPAASKQDEPREGEALDIDNLENIRERSGGESELEGSDAETSTLPASIMAKAFSSGKGKEKEKAQAKQLAKRSKKDDEEIGPSGQTYTPLEKQVGTCSYPEEFQILTKFIRCRSLL